MTASPAPPGTDRLAPRDGLRALATLRHGMGGLYEALEVAREGLGPVFVLGFGRFRPVVVASPGALREALVDRRDAFRWRPEGDPVAHLFRRSLLVTDGEEHDHARRVMLPAFEMPRLREQAGAILAIVDDELGRWPSDGRVEVVEAMRRIAWRSFERVFFGYELGDAELRATLPGLLAALRYIGPGTWVLRGRAGPPPRAVASLEEHVRRVAAWRRSGGDGKGEVLLDLLNAAFDEERVRDHALTMLIAGHDTSTAQLSWALHLLARDRGWLARATREARGLAPSELVSARADDLPVIEAVLKETLRLWPPIHVGGRRAGPGAEVAGYAVPEGERVMLSYFLVQRDGELWPRAREFDPGRWLDGGSAPVPYSYLPFGGGPRNCVGAGFANFEARLVLARILQRFDIAVTRRPLRGAMGATLEPRGGRLRVRRR